jgi:hypothetical protein
MPLRLSANNMVDEHHANIQQLLKNDAPKGKTTQGKQCLTSEVVRFYFVDHATFTQNMDMFLEH